MELEYIGEFSAGDEQGYSFPCKANQALGAATLLIENLIHHIGLIEKADNTLRNGVDSTLIT